MYRNGKNGETPKLGVKNWVVTHKLLSGVFAALAVFAVFLVTLAAQTPAHFASAVRVNGQSKATTTSKPVHVKTVKVAVPVATQAPVAAQAPATTQAAPTTQAPAPTTQAPVVTTTTQAPVPTTTQAPATTQAPVTTQAAAPVTQAPVATERVVSGVAVTLGSGNFVGGKDVAPGLYNVTTTPGASGNFVVQGANLYDEILGNGGGFGVPEVRVQIHSGDQIQISGLAQVYFAPVTTPFVTTYGPVNLYAGKWTVGQDLGPGRYTATPAPGQTGNFVINREGVDEILGSSPGVPSVTFTVQSGDVIRVSGLSQVMLTPS